MNIVMSKPLTLMSAPQKRKAHHWYLTGLWVSSMCQGRADPHSVLPLVLTLEVRRSNSAADGTEGEKILSWTGKKDLTGAAGA